MIGKGPYRLTGGRRPKTVRLEGIGASRRTRAERSRPARSTRSPSAPWRHYAPRRPHAVARPSAGQTLPDRGRGRPSGTSGPPADCFPSRRQRHRNRGSRRNASPRGRGPRSGAAMVAAGRNGPEILNGLLRASCAFRRGEVLFPGDLSRFRCQTTVAPTKKGELVERQRRGGASGQAKRVAFLRTGARAAVAVRRLE